MKPSQISLQYGASRGTIYYIKKNQVKLNDFLKYSYSRTKTCKNLKSCSFPKMEEALFYWFIERRCRFLSTNDLIITEKAK
ncbi:hypothetical protein A3Q56_06320 [Intoshia linei]|uniref:HTH psq-type domain-containing protein n=1 Tax=Intoshia linei TaxID=1819745 RepID=A0A177AXN9_9BILA|nr:hypothetical protein A3Q56_06320 [Intoshia linei]